MQKVFFASLKKVEDGADDTITVTGIASTRLAIPPARSSRRPRSARRFPLSRISGNP